MIGKKLVDRYAHQSGVKDQLVAEREVVLTYALGLPGKTEELFQPFDQRGGDRTGLGLGLSIGRRGVEANGGTLRVHDIAGKGCVFTIDLPLSRHL